MMDPPRSEARDAIGLCHQAGIAVKMITGDQKITAAAIAAELGIKGEVLSSDELKALDDTQLSGRIDDIGVFARTTPEQKVRIVRALTVRGHVTAMTGDGVNDAPALKSADIGVAMGVTGTDVTKEAATMVLTDDNFATIVDAVQGGRTIYDNIVKFVRFQLSTNIGAILTVFIAPFLGLPLPFSPIQLLWINIIMDGPPAMALGVDPSHPDIMNHPPRKVDERILTLRRLGNIAVYGSTMAVGTLSVLLWGLQTKTEEQALTLAFTTFILFQVFNVFNARADRSSTFNSTFFHNRFLWLAVITVAGLQLLVVHWEVAQAIFHTTALTVNDWLLAILVASSVLLLEESRKGLQWCWKHCLQ
jgi:Ca2+-transporting ATPase